MLPPALVRHAADRGSSRPGRRTKGGSRARLATHAVGQDQAVAGGSFQAAHPMVTYARRSRASRHFSRSTTRALTASGRGSFRPWSKSWRGQTKVCRHNSKLGLSRALPLGAAYGANATLLALVPCTANRSTLSARLLLRILAADHDQATPESQDRNNDAQAGSEDQGRCGSCGRARASKHHQPHRGPDPQTLSSPRAQS